MKSILRFLLITKAKLAVFYKPSETHKPRQVRYLSYLSQFNCDIKQILGHSNVTSDCLSQVVIRHVFDRDQLPFSALALAREQSFCQIVQEEPINLVLLVDVSLECVRPILSPNQQDCIIWY